METTKKSYVAPKVRCVKFKVEGGYSTSSVPQTFFPESNNQVNTATWSDGSAVDGNRFGEIF